MVTIKTKFTTAGDAGKKSARVLLLVFFLLVLASCSRLKVAQEVNPEANFSNMKTYAWTPMKTEGDVNKRNAEDIEKAIQADLKFKGFTLTSSSPDFMVTARISVEKVVTIPPDVILPNGRGALSDFYNEATIVLDFLDARSSQPLYSRTGVLVIDAAQWTPEKREKTIQKGIKKLLKDFPPDTVK